MPNCWDWTWGVYISGRGGESTGESLERGDGHGLKWLVQEFPLDGLLWTALPVDIYSLPSPLNEHVLTSKDFPGSSGPVGCSKEEKGRHRPLWLARHSPLLLSWLLQVVAPFPMKY